VLIVSLDDWPADHHQNGGLQIDAATYQAWEQERAEWEQHSREWEQSYDSLSAEYEATKHEKEDILRQLEDIRQAHEHQAVLTYSRVSVLRDESDVTHMP
jgi:hypothetical protein